jgi:hypothetical protein
MLHLLTTALGTLQSKACSMVCPQLLAKADIKAIRGHSGFDPQRTSTGLKSCTAQVPDMAVALRYAAKLPLVATKCNSIN